MSDVVETCHERNRWLVFFGCIWQYSRMFAKVKPNGANMLQCVMTLPLELSRLSDPLRPGMLDHTTTGEEYRLFDDG